MNKPEVYTVTLTFGDQGEHHPGMKKEGKMAPCGFSLEDLEKAADWFEEQGIKTTIFDLKPEHLSIKAESAYILVAWRGLTAICDPDALFQEQYSLKKDTKAFMYGRVVNKRARHNLVFGDRSQVADHTQKQGTVISFEDVPITKQLRAGLSGILGDKTLGLVAEGNYYYDRDCGIGLHGDRARRKVIGVRLGSSMRLCFIWYYRNKPVSDRMEIELGDSDIYFLSEKAVGTDWKSSSIYTLRHAAGFTDKYLPI